MKLNSDNITNLITAANIESTNEAIKLFGENSSCGRLRPLTALIAKFLRSFVKNENKSVLKERLIYSSLDSLKNFLQYLKLLKLKKVI